MIVNSLSGLEKPRLDAIQNRFNVATGTASRVLTDLRGCSALQLFAKKDLSRIYSYLHNENGPLDYVMGFRDRKTGSENYKRAKKVPVDRAISWSLASLEGRKKPEESLAFVPYSTNADQMSRWGGFDFDAHDGDTDRATRLAFSAFQSLLNCESAVILETSGSGWHVWAISLQFKPISYWIRLLKGVAQDIGAVIQSGICEIFPPDTLSRGFGKGLRAPGAWNPATNTCSEIYWHNADDLIDQLPPFSEKVMRIGEVRSFYSDSSPIEKEISLSLLPLSAWGKIIGGVEGWRIDQQATRHSKLSGLVGGCFYQVSHDVAKQVAHAQFTERTVVTNADENEHLEDFESLWNGFEKVWFESLNNSERERFGQLVTDAERGAFRIIRSYARKAGIDGAVDFPIARDNLGERIGITGRGAGELRKKFVRCGIIAQTARHRDNVAAARFRWLLAESTVDEPF